MIIEPEHSNRRTFFQAAIASAALAETVIGAGESLPRPKETRKGDMLYRSFGKTGETVSVIGVGGSHIGQTSSQEVANKIIRTAIDNGINFMDNSWDFTSNWRWPGRDQNGQGLARWIPSKSVPDDQSRRPHESSRG